MIILTVSQLRAPKAQETFYSELLSNINKTDLEKPGISDLVNSRRFPGFLDGFQNSRCFPGLEEMVVKFQVFPGFSRLWPP